MKKGIALLVLILVSVFGFSAVGFSAEESEEPSTLQLLDRTESMVFGEGRTGGLIARLTDLEISMFGRELPGSISDRQNALINFIEKGTPAQPPMLFKLGVAEWVLNQMVFPLDPIESRISKLEKILEGASMETKPLAMRLERLLGLLLAENVTWQDTEIAESTVIKAELRESLYPSGIKVGEQVKMTLAEDLVLGTSLVAPRGSTIKAHVSKVEKPKSFGRPSEIEIAFDHLIPLGPEEIPLTRGQESAAAEKAEKAQLAAVGTSFVGAILLGPIGLAGGFLVRGDAKEIPQGTQIYVQTSELVRVSSYPVPPGLQGMITEKEDEAVSDDLFEGMEEATQ